jgi:hypothetical protein
VTTFLRLLKDSDKASALLEAVRGETANRFEVDSGSFSEVAGTPFAYWISDSVRSLFRGLPPFCSDGRIVRQGLATADDFQWVRLWWEQGDAAHVETRLVAFAKGGAFSPFYADVTLSVRWGVNGTLLKTWKLEQLRLGNIAANNSKCWNESNYFRAGITWPTRTQAFGPRVLPEGCIFGHKGVAAFDETRSSERSLACLALMNSVPFRALVETRLNAGDATARSYEVGIIQDTPVPNLSTQKRSELAEAARRAWSLRRRLDTVIETSHAFLLPTALRVRLGDFAPPTIEADLTCIQSDIDSTAFDLYGFSNTDRQAAACSSSEVDSAGADDDESEVGEYAEAEVAARDALLSWAVGVAFGRFDWRLATGERQAPTEPEPFDPLPAKSPGMLPDGATPFHDHPGILVDDPGHPHDLARLVEAVLERVKVPMPEDVRRWLQTDFFPFHLQRYSKSRRKAPIYWPLATGSGSYTIWIYYPALNSQTLYRAVNDFVEPKLKQVSERASQLRSKGGGRNRAEEREFEETESLEIELSEFRDSLLKIAKNYHPNQDDGVQITAAPLWQLFRHRPWQKMLKDTWGKLEKGEYDWAHLAMNYWPERVREKCKSDRSLAIAHGLEDLYVEPAASPKKKRGKRKTEDDE